RVSQTDWIQAYRLTNREFRVGVPEQSPLMGKTLEELDLRKTCGADVIAIDRKRRFSRQLIQPSAGTEIQAGDVLLIDLFLSKCHIEEIRERFGLELLPPSGTYFNDRTQEIGMAEVIVTPDSDLVGKTVIEAGFRSRFGLTVIGLRHGRVPQEGGALNEKLR